MCWLPSAIGYRSIFYDVMTQIFTKWNFQYTLSYLSSLQFLSYPLLMRKMTCSEKWDNIHRSLIPSVNLLANMIGSILGGIAIDKIGRRPVFIVSSLLAIIAGLLKYSLLQRLINNIIVRLRLLMVWSSSCSFFTVAETSLQNCPGVILFPIESNEKVKPQI